MHDGDAMARPRSKTDVSLFPFISVLCAVIGVLVLFIVLILSTRVIVEEQRYEETEAYQRRPHPGRSNADESGVNQEIFAELEKELERLSEQLRQRQGERDALQKKLGALEDLLEFKKTELSIRFDPVRPPEFAKPEAVAIVPDRDREHKVELKPILVEVSASGYIVHPDRSTYPPITREEGDSKAQYVVAPQLTSYLQRAQARRSREYLLFLIHPNGVTAFDTMQSYLATKHKDVRMGWEPFSREWVLANAAAE